MARVAILLLSVRWTGVVSKLSAFNLRLPGIQHGLVLGMHVRVGVCKALVEAAVESATKSLTGALWIVRAPFKLKACELT